MAFQGRSPGSGSCSLSLVGLDSCCLGLLWFGATPGGGARAFGAAQFTGSRTSHPWRSPTTEASFADPTNMSFMIEVKLK